MRKPKAVKLCIPYTEIFHPIASQVKKRKELELKEQLDALRREHTETLQGVCHGSGAPCSSPPLSPLLLCPFGCLWGQGDSVPCSPPLWASGGASCPSVPILVALNSCSSTELQGAHEQEKLLLTESHHRSEAALQVPAEKSLRRGAWEGLRAICWCPTFFSAHLSPWCAWGLHQLLQPWCYLGTTAQQSPGSEKNPRYLSFCFSPGSPRRKFRH